MHSQLWKLTIDMIWFQFEKTTTQIRRAFRMLVFKANVFPSGRKSSEVLFCKPSLLYCLLFVWVCPSNVKNPVFIWRLFNLFCQGRQLNQLVFCFDFIQQTAVLPASYLGQQRNQGCSKGTNDAIHKAYHKRQLKRVSRFGLLTPLHRKTHLKNPTIYEVVPSNGLAWVAWRRISIER